MAHAYLIMAHENTLVLRTLLKLIDDERNDIYVHIDRKSAFLQEELLGCVQKSKLYFSSQRIDVRWANISQVSAEYVLFEDAYNKAGYDYYHLLSGADLPLKPQDEIHQFFDLNRGKEFIGFAPKAIPDRVRYFQLFSRQFRESSKFLGYSRQVFIFLQKILGYNRFSDMKSWKIMNGTNWVSVTNEFVKYLLENKGLILSKMKYGKSPDEYYKQTLAYNSIFRERIYNIENEFESCSRMIDWNRGKPYEWKNEDYDEIQRSDKLFVRKINKEDIELVRCIEESISKYNV